MQRVFKSGPLPWAASLFLVVAAGSARAEGPGVRAGVLEFHPSTWLEGGFDNNVFYDSTRDGSGSDLETATVLRLGGGLNVENRNPSQIGLSLGGRFTYRYLTSFDDPDGGLAADSRSVEARNGLASAAAQAVVALFPQSAVTLELHENFRYSENPTFETAVVGFERVENAIGPDLRFRPGGRALELRLGYRYRLVDFLEEKDSGAARYEKEAHETRLLTQWRWLPKTSLLLDLQYHVVDFSRGDAASNRNARPFRAEGGVRGLLTQRISVVALAGYLNTFNEVGQSFVGPVARLEVNYVTEPTLSVGVGYTHDAESSGYSNYHIVDGVFLRSELHFLGRFTLAGKLAYDYIRFVQDGAPVAGGQAPGERADPVLRVQASFTYSPREWLSAGVEWLLERNATEHFVPYEGGVDYSDYARQLVLVRLAAEY